MSTLPAPADRPVLPSLPVLGDDTAASFDSGPVFRRPRAGAPIARVAQAADSGRGRDGVHAGPGRRARAGNGLRECSMPESLGMLDPPHGDVHDSGRRLHAALRVLRGQTWPTGGSRPRRARTPGRSVPSAGFAPRGHHVGHAGRPGRRRRRPFSPMRPGRAPSAPAPRSRCSRPTSTAAAI